MVKLTLHEGVVDPEVEHMDLRYGHASSGSWATWLPVARIAPPQDGRFAVEFLCGNVSAKDREARQATEQELDFYIVNKRERDPWSYLRYHCESSANVYSSVHWSHFPDGSEAQ